MGTLRDRPARLARAAGRALADRPGRIVTAESRYHASNPGSDLGSSGHAVTIAYEYEVGGRTHTGQRIAFFEGGPLSHLLGQGERDKLMDRYTPGQDVAVRYEPSAPDQAVLEPGVRDVKLLMHVLAALFLLALGAKYLLW